MKSIDPGRVPRTALALIEVLMVIGVLGVLMGLALPAAQSAREAARRVRCQNNLRQIGLALHQYHDAYTCYPVVCTNLYDVPSDRFVYRGFYSVHSRLLPYLEHRRCTNRSTSRRGRPRRTPGNGSELPAMSNGCWPRT